MRDGSKQNFERLMHKTMNKLSNGGCSHQNIILKTMKCKKICLVLTDCLGQILVQKYSTAKPQCLRMEKKTRSPGAFFLKAELLLT